MSNIKISLITVVYNAANTIERCIASVLAQNYSNIEYIIIDGGSTDDTLQIIDRYRSQISVFLSEPDKGIYDAMNKGIKLATGNIVGTLNADDHFGYDDALMDIANAFKQENIDIVYGNLDYVNPNGSILRKWVAGKYVQGHFNWGWMPPHPTFYCKRELFEHFGAFDSAFGTAADYELMTRFIHLNKAKTYYLNKTIIKMSVGGVSNQNYINRYNAWIFDHKAMKKNGVLFPSFAIVLKPLRKIFQYF